MQQIGLLLSTFLLLIPIISYASDWTIDPGFTANPGAEGSPRRIRSLASDTQGYIIIGGDFFRYNGIANTGIIKIDAQGTVLSGFLVGEGFDNVVEVVKTDSQDRIYVGGDFSSYHGETVSRLIRLLPDGTRDTSFSVSVNNRIHSLLIDETNNHIYIGGRFSQVQGQPRNRIARLFLDGTLDTSFDPGVGPNSTVRGIAGGPNNTIYIVGRFTTIGGVSRGGVARLVSGGSLDLSFDPGSGVAGGVPNVHDIASLPDGSIVIGGDFVTYQGVPVNGAVWINPNGSIRHTIVSGEPVRTYNAVIVQPDESIVIGGEGGIFLRFDRHGIRDTPTTQTASSIIHSLMYYQPTHSLYGGGVFATHNGQTRRGVTSILQSPRRDSRPDGLVFNETFATTPGIVESPSLTVGGITTGITVTVSTGCEISLNNDTFDTGPRYRIQHNDIIKIRTIIQDYAMQRVCVITGGLTVGVRTGIVGSFLDIIWSGGSTQLLNSGHTIITGRILATGQWNISSPDNWQIASNSGTFGSMASVSSGDIIILSGHLLGPTILLMTGTTGWQTQPLTISLALSTPSLTPVIGSPSTIQHSGSPGGGSARRLLIDDCPKGDFSPSYYDKRCDTTQDSITNALDDTIQTHTDTPIQIHVQTGSGDNSMPACWQRAGKDDQSMLLVYQWLITQGLSHTIDDFCPYDQITREIAASLLVHIINIQNTMTPSIHPLRSCLYRDWMQIAPKHHNATLRLFMSIWHHGTNSSRNTG
ncbi:MAG: delta-60 repeat domain-containing protein [Candidatus Absconditabacterales bacterium]|nr:delta-60 repeat domain-containing protein [Candidatus Absconditabacterales bacterium]